MQLVTNSGKIINDAPVASEKTRKYLNQFWKFPSKEEVKKEKEKYYVSDCKREWMRRDDATEHNISNVI